MAKKNDGPDNNDAVDFDGMSKSTAATMQRIATIQRTSQQSLQHQGARIAHLLTMITSATGAISVLKHGGQPVRQRVDSDSGEDWKSLQPSKYDGGADAALDSLIAGAAMRLLKFVEDDSEWDKSGMDKMHQNLLDWSQCEKMRAYQEGNAAAACRRPCVLHTVELFNGPRSLWYAVMVPFAVDDSIPVIGVGETPLDAMADFDRCFSSGDMHPSAALWIEEQRLIAEKSAKTARKRRTTKKGKCPSGQ